MLLVVAVAEAVADADAEEMTLHRGCWSTVGLTCPVEVGIENSGQG